MAINQLMLPNVGGSFARGLAQGQGFRAQDEARAEQARLGQARNALSQAIQSGGADSDGARNALAMLDPGSAMTMQRDDARDTRNFDRGVLESDRGFAFQQQGRQIQQANATAAQSRSAASAQATATTDAQNAKNEMGAAILRQVLQSGDPASAWPRALEIARQRGLDLNGIPTEYPGDDAVAMFQAELSGNPMDMRGAGGGMAGGANQPKFGLNPVMGTDASGNRVAMQLSDTGEVKAVDFGEGFNIAPKYERLDLGDRFAFADPLTREVVYTVPKNIAGEVAQRVEGKTAAEKLAAAPGALKSANQMLASIDGIINDPELDNATGLLSFVPVNVPGFNANVRARMDQLGGQAFLQAFESLKGGGTITEIEGLKAEKAIARLSTAVKKEQYVEALNDLKSVVNSGIAGLKAMSAKTRTYNPSTGALE